MTCTKGFLIGSNTITCQASGQWSAITAQCASQAPGSNSPPLRILLSSPLIPENSPRDTVVGKLVTVDDDDDHSDDENDDDDDYNNDDDDDDDDNDYDAEK